MYLHSQQHASAISVLDKVDQHVPTYLLCTVGRFMGLYFAQISSEGVCEAVESADAYIFVGPTFNDYSTCAFSHLLSESKMVKIDARRVTVAGKFAPQNFLTGHMLVATIPADHGNHVQSSISSCVCVCVCVFLCDLCSCLLANRSNAKMFIEQASCISKVLFTRALHVMQVGVVTQRWSSN